MTAPADDAAGAGPQRAGFPLRPPVAAAVNHLLASASWARERLKPFAGKSVRFDLAPFAATLVILDSGEVGDSGAAPADAGFTLTPAAALRVLAGDPEAWRDVQMSGDTALAREILTVAQNLEWDVEEDLSRVIGDVAAHRAVAAAREFKRWQQGFADSFARSAAAYWTEERPLIASRQDVARFVHEVDALRDDVARLDQRLARVAGRAR